MIPLPVTPLDPWIKRKMGLDPAGRFTRDDVRRHQMVKLRETLTHAVAHSPFYRRRLAGPAGEGIVHPSEFSDLPFTTADDLVRDPLEFLCVSQTEVARVVTLHSSGTTGRPKRLFFSDADLELTIDFFQHGMSTLVRAGERVLILMPGELPGSVGDLLVKGLSRMGVEGIVHGPVQDPAEAIEAILTHRADCLVGIPVQVLALVRHPRGARIRQGSIRSVLLSTDYVPEPLVAAIQRAWSCQVYQHYGMSEMGYGGGVECDAHCGYHLRDADVFVEIVDPSNGRPLPDGVSGEVVFTTLTRQAMPLIRYRTGDMARFLPEVCPCGSVLRRLSKVQGRFTNDVALGPSTRLHLAALDEALFAIPEVLNFQAELLPAEGHIRLCVTICCDAGRFPQTVCGVHEALVRVPAVCEAVAEGVVKIDPIRLSPENWFTTGTAKRALIDRRQEGGSL